MNETIDYKVYKVFSAGITRKLLRNGYRIKDVEPNENNYEKTVFVFHVEGDFMKDIEKFKEEIKAQRKQG
jgi:hypothetical protein